MRKSTAAILMTMMLAVTMVFISPAFAGMQTRGYEQREQVMNLQGVINQDGNLVTPAGTVFVISPDTQAGRDLKAKTGDNVVVRGYIPTSSTYKEIPQQPLVMVEEYHMASQWNQGMTRTAEVVPPTGYKARGLTPQERAEYGKKPATKAEGYYPQTMGYYGTSAHMAGKISSNGQFVDQNGQVFYISPFNQAGQAVMSKEGQNVVITGTIQPVGPNASPVVSVESFTTP